MKKKRELNESRLVLSCLLKKKKYGGQEKSLKKFSRHLKNYHIERTFFPI